MDNNFEGGEDYQKILAQIGNVTMAVGGIDNGLAMTLGALLAPAPSAGYALELASIFVFSARSMTQRTELIIKTFDLRFAPDFARHKNHNLRRTVEFLEKAYRRIFESISANIWVRNLAAHGSIDLSKGEPRLIPALFDFEGRKRLATKHPSYAGGMTRQQIAKYAGLLSEDSKRIGLLAHSISMFLQWSSVDHKLFLEPINLLAADLGIAPLRLQDPRAGPPMRQARNKAPHKK
ncbi:hypothetical protein NKH61_05120 [Mesorhizobium sp. M1005]|uniref:hypothetical protein n=1 Tax=unclassified Mesorhizobium TaxID=325217 RepID=UPI00333B6943